jgi:hypothetical protein
VSDLTRGEGLCPLYMDQAAMHLLSRRKIAMG